MKKIVFLVVVVFILIGVSCSHANKKGKDTLILIKTELGDIKLKLYDETPEHKANFLKLVGQEYYNGVLFHRVINDFMIQGGDPESKNAKPGVRLGGGNPGYTIPAEINSKLIHKKGALAAARRGGPSNPEKRSSGSQFYIVKGFVHTNGKLDTMELSLNNRAKQELVKQVFTAATEELNSYRKNKEQAKFNFRVAELRAKVDSIWQTRPKFKYTPEQRAVYTSIGGYPSLDGAYTVFGEVVEGLDVLDKISAVETDKYNRPLQDLKMEVELVK